MKLYKITPLILQATLWPFTRVILKLFVNFKVEGIHNIEEVRGAIIFASNHVSELDPVLVRAALPCFSRFAPLFYVSRENYLDSIEGIRKHLYGGVFFKAWGAYPVEAGKKDYAKSLKNHVNLLKDGCSVCIFPEGRMSEDGNLGEVHGGTAFLAKVTNAKICPVTINGSFGINLSSFFSRERQIIVRFKKCHNINNLLPQKEELEPEDYRLATRTAMVV